MIFTTSVDLFRCLRGKDAVQMKQTSFNWTEMQQSL